MIKLIASDLDGTLLLNGAQSLDAEYYELISRITDMGVIFAASSGRQYPNLKRLFGPVADKIAYICEDGALVMYHDEIIFKSALEKKTAYDIMDDIYAMPNCEILLSGMNTSYLKPKNNEYLVRIRDIVKNNVVIMDRYEEVTEDFLKISVCDLSGIEHSRKHFEEKWSQIVETAVSGNLYLDFTVKGINKGAAIQAIQKRFGIDKKESAAFGDNFNDISMLQSVEYSYGMKNADEAVKKHCAYETDKVADVLKGWIKNGFN